MSGRVEQRVKSLNIVLELGCLAIKEKNKKVVLILLNSLMRRVESLVDEGVWFGV